MSNAARMLANTKCKFRSAKCLPGQILQNQRSQHPEGRSKHASHLRPLPKTLTSGSLTNGSIFPPLSRNLSGLNVSGSGYTLSL